VTAGATWPIDGVKGNLNAVWTASGIGRHVVGRGGASRAGPQSSAAASNSSSTVVLAKCDRVRKSNCLGFNRCRFDRSGASLA
jgi:hypothetical protein